MNKSLRLTLGAAALLATLPAYAGVSLDRTSPSVGGACPFIVNPGNIYSLVVPPAGGCDMPWGLGPVTEVTDANLGLLGGDNVDAVSANTATGKNILYHIHFTADRGSLGLPPSAYRAEALLNQAASDIWRMNNLTSISPQASMAGCVAAAVGGAQGLFRNQDNYDFIFTALAGAGPLGGNQDNMDGLELDDMDVVAPVQMHDVNVYLSLDAASPSLGAGSPADIFWAPAGFGFVGWAAAGQLGLAAGDDVDGLVVWDRGQVGFAEPGIDLVLFSLAPGSPSLGLGGSAADIFVSDLTGAFCLYVPANALGMRFADNIDGIDVMP